MRWTTPRTATAGFEVSIDIEKGLSELHRRAPRCSRFETPTETFKLDVDRHPHTGHRRAWVLGQHVMQKLTSLGADPAGVGSADADASGG